MKSFKSYILENESSDVFNSFVEKTITTNTVNANSANDFLNQIYNYQGLIYRVIFCSLTEIENLFNEEKEPDRKAIAAYISKKMNPNRYAFFSKTLRGILNLIKTPSLFKISEDLIGVVFAQKSSACIDLSKYDGKNIEVKKRLDQTQEVLSFEDLSITNITAMYYFGEGGWEFETELNRPISIGKPAEKEAEPSEETPEDVRPTDTPVQQKSQGIKDEKPVQ